MIEKSKIKDGKNKRKKKEITPYNPKPSERYEKKKEINPFLLMCMRKRSRNKKKGKSKVDFDPPE